MRWTDQRPLRVISGQGCLDKTFGKRTGKRVDDGKGFKFIKNFSTVPLHHVTCNYVQVYKNGHKELSRKVWYNGFQRYIRKLLNISGVTFWEREFDSSIDFYKRIKERFHLKENDNSLNKTREFQNVQSYLTNTRWSLLNKINFVYQRAFWVNLTKGKPIPMACVYGSFGRRAMLALSDDMFFTG